MTSPNQTSAQKGQKAREWWNSLSEQAKKEHQDDFKNKSMPTDNELITVYEQSGQTS